MQALCLKIRQGWKQAICLPVGKVVYFPKVLTTFFFFSLSEEFKKDDSRGVP